jgi:hypothetical protein
MELIRGYTSGGPGCINLSWLHERLSLFRFFTIKKIAVLSAFVLWSNLVYAQDNPGKLNVEKRKYTTQRLAGNAVKLDGIPNEAAWDVVPWSDDFIQHQPTENIPPTEQSHFKILYDDKYLYIAYQCLDSKPETIEKRLGRRDEFPGDWIEVNIDSYHDLRTAFSFTVSASGVRGDEAVSLNGNYWDSNWNPIWFAKTHTDASGWTAEIKIPFSQLRYGNEADKVWGIQVQRRLFRKDERSFWQFIPQSSGVWVSAFGELHGLKGIPAQKQIEVAPYIVAQTTKYHRVDGNPFATGSDSRIAAGVDGKVAVTSDLILDFTVNPDFGQVEADPSSVRIDGFQNFFEERRPFFMESRNIFDYQLTGSSAGGDYDADLLFYSRRIGGRPHGFPTLQPGEYVKLPDNTSILGAAKFSGKTKKGWSIGVLESITRRELATIDFNGSTRDELVEPLTSYFVGRLQKDINNGQTVLGGILTAVNREDGLNTILHNKAYSGGFDFLHQWNSRTWFFKGNTIFSHVAGTPEAIWNTQMEFEHLFQRPNIREAHPDIARTSLTGTGGTFKLGKTGGNAGKRGEVLKFETGVTWRSPQLELNDIGFMLSADEINHFTWTGLQYQKPFSIFRNGNVNYNHWARWDFSGQLLYLAFNTNTHATFKNYWQTGIGLTWNPYEVSNNALRGGSSLRKPPGGGYFINLNSDSRKKVVGQLNISNSVGFGHTVAYDSYSLGLNTQPLDALNINVSANYSNFWRRQDQYVDEVAYNNMTQTIVAQVNQQTVSMTLRLNYNITPDLTVQYYGQPFITRALYSNYGKVVDPLNMQYDDRFHRYADKEIKFVNDRYEVDENGDGNIDFHFSAPDFNFVQFRSNLVIRWEYKPGSELYLVWAQGATPDVAGDLTSPLQHSLFDNLFSQQSKNIGLIKFTYRFLK